MGGFTDNIGTLVQAGVGLVAGQAKDNSSAADAYAARQAALDAQYRAGERKRQDLLAAQLAAQRARLAAAGIGSSGGSADALMRGLTERSASDGAEASNAYTRQSDVLARSYRAANSSSSSLDGMLGPALRYGPSLLQSFGGDA